MIHVRGVLLMAIPMLFIESFSFMNLAFFFFFVFFSAGQELGIWVWGKIGSNSVKSGQVPSFSAFGGKAIVKTNACRMRRRVSQNSTR